MRQASEKVEQTLHAFLDGTKQRNTFGTTQPNQLKKTEVKKETGKVRGRKIESKRARKGESEKKRESKESKRVKEQR